MLLALSVACLFQTLIWIILVAIVISLIVWAIGYLSRSESGLAIPIPPIITKLIVVLGVIICVYFLVMCLVVGHPLEVP